MEICFHVMILTSLLMLITFAHDVPSSQLAPDSSASVEEHEFTEQDAHDGNRLQDESVSHHSDSLLKDNSMQQSVDTRKEHLYAEKVVESECRAETCEETGEKVLAEQTAGEHVEETDMEEESVDNKSKVSYHFFPFWTILKKVVESLVEEFGHDVEKPVEEEKENQTILNETSVVEIVENVKNDTLTEPEEIAEMVKNITEPNKTTKFQCVGRNVTENDTNIVQIVNNTELLSSLNFDKNETGTDCVLVLFYAPWCPFCSEAAPAFNALARAFKQLDILAVDAAHFSNLNARFGTASVPNILLFHQSRSVVRYNQTVRTFESFVQFVKNITGMEPNTTVEVSEEDYIGPLPSQPTEDMDYLLWVAWIFFVVCSIYFFVQSSYGQQWINKILLLWQEHQHID